MELRPAAPVGLAARPRGHDSLRRACAQHAARACSRSQARPGVPSPPATLYRSIHHATVARGRDVAAREAVLASARVLVAATAVALVVSVGGVGSGAAR